MGTPVNALTDRRRLRWLIGLTIGGLALGLAGCGSSSDNGGTAEEDTAGGSSDGAYPMTVQTRDGEVTIEQAPERIVALSPVVADELISLGVEPIAVATDEDTLQAAYPWMTDALQGLTNPDLATANGEPRLEAIAQTKPDLVLADTWQITDKTVFQQLNEIAPTVIPDSEAINVDWDQRLLSVAQVVDKTDEAKQLISEISDSYAKVGASVPDISSKTYQFVRADPDGYGFGNGSVLELFGLKPAPNQDNTQNGPPLSKENTAQLDADVLGVWAPTEDLRKQLDSDPLFQALPAVKQGTVFYPDLAMATAGNTPAPMALKWLKPKLAPTIEALR